MTIPYFLGENDWIEIKITSAAYCRALNGYINGNHDHKELVQTVQVWLYQ